MRPSIRKLGSAGNSVRLSQLCKLSECDQVAAVCYRVRRGAIEFLLVQTRRSGRWTFPKGGAEPGLSHAQAAAIEAFEEAGVHGRIEEASFARYVCRKPSDSRSSALVVSAHLCQVLRLSKPKESNRNRTWLSVEDTKQRLRQGRKNGDADEFVRVVQRAVARIRQLGNAGDPAVIDRLQAESLRERALQKVHFEALTPPYDRGEQDSLPPHVRHRLAKMRCFTAPAGADRRETMSRDVLPFNVSRQFNQTPRLLSGLKKMKALGTGAKSD